MPRTSAEYNYEKETESCNILFLLLTDAKWLVQIQLLLPKPGVVNLFYP